MAESMHAFLSLFDEQAREYICRGSCIKQIKSRVVEQNGLGADFARQARLDHLLRQQSSHRKLAEKRRIA